MSEIIKTIHLSKTFGKTQALSDLSVNIEEHSITGLIGRNGSGKTTLLKILAGILDVSDGEALVFGEKPMDNLPVLNRLVYTYHNVSYEKSLDLQTILYAYQNMFADFDSVFADKLLKYFELGGKMKYKNLSQGRGSIFNFICAISCRAPVTFLDEPVLGMDVTVRKSAYEILLRDFAEHPRTFVISSHLLSEIEGLLSDILLIEQGKLILHSGVDDVRQSVYRLDGDAAMLQAFTQGKKIIAQSTSELSSFIVVYEPLDDAVSAAARASGLEVSTVRAEDLCVYLTRQNKEGELECLW